MIAAVLLIAFTMAVASIFAQWAPQLIKDAQGDTKNETKNIRKCSGVIIDVSDGNVTHATVEQSAGDDPIGKFTVTWYYDDADPVQVSSDLSGSTRNITVVNNSKSGSYGTLSSIEADPTECEGAPAGSYEP